MENKVNPIEKKLTIELKQMEPSILKKTQLYISEDLIEKNTSCTYFQLGDLPIEQPMYICGRCDFYQLDPMCESCFNSCHKECTLAEKRKLSSKALSPLTLQSNSTVTDPQAVKSSQSPSKLKRRGNRHVTGKIIFEQKESTNKGRVFTCLCGKTHKHCIIIAAELDKGDHKKENKCNLENEMSLSLFPSRNKFNCQDCMIEICNICNDGCHFHHTTVPVGNISTKGRTSSCDCYSSNHISNDFLLSLYFTGIEYTKGYPALKASQTKIFNMMFLTNDLMGNMFSFLKTVSWTSFTSFLNVKNQTKNQTKNHTSTEKMKLLGNYETPHHDTIGGTENGDLYSGSKHDENMRKFLDLSGILFNILDAKNDKCYYYNDVVKKAFSYESSFLLVEHLCEMDYNSDNSRTIFNLVGIVFYLHLKADFQKVKNLTISDFMSSNMVTRLRLKNKFLSIRNIKNNNSLMGFDDGMTYNSNFIQDFNKYFNEYSSLPAISLKLSKIITACLPALNIYVNPKLYKVCLRFINFGLKKMYFTKLELKTLIDNLYEFMKDFFVSIIDLKNHRDLKANLEGTKYVFYYLIKICYLIAVNYNDLVTEHLAHELRQEFLTQKPTQNKQKMAYIHTNEEYGDKLLKMILKTVKLSESYNLDIQVDRKIINICNESLKIFSVSDNFYMRQLNNLSEEEFYATHRIHIVNEDNLLISSKLSGNIEKIFIGDYAESLNGERKVYLEIDRIFKEILDTNTNSKLYDADIEHIQKDDTKISDYKLKLFNFFSKIIGYSGEEEFYFQYKNLLKIKSNPFYDNLIFGDFDEIISKYFSLFEYKCLDDRDVNGALAIYLLYCLDKRSLEHLCIGKNLSIISKLFSSPKNANSILVDEVKIEFLYLLIKGIYLNNIDLSNDKCIYNLTQIIDLIIPDDEKTEEKLPKVSEIPFKVKQRLLKIFLYLKESLEFEEFESLKNQFFNKFRSLLDPASFKNYMNEYMNKMGETPEINDENYLPQNLEMEAKDFRNNIDAEYFDKEVGHIEVNLIMRDEKEKFIQSDEKKNQQNKLKFSESFKLSKHILSSKFKSEPLKFYFSFFHFLSIDTYYILNDDVEEKQQLDEVYKFVDLKYMHETLSKPGLPLNYRTYLLVFLRTFYFIDILNSRNINSEMQYITNSEMQKHIFKTYIDANEKEVIEQKAKLIDKIISVMEIFINELENFDKFLKNQKYYFADVKEYLIQIVYSTKIISDFIYNQKSILDNISWYLYKIGKRFIQKANAIKKILLSLTNRGEIGDISDDDFTISKQMENIHFNIYDKELIYNLISDSLIDILKVTNLDKNFKLEKYLREHDSKIKNDFTPPAVIGVKGFDEFYTNSNIEKNATFKNKQGFFGEEEEREFVRDQKISAQQTFTLKKLLVRDKKISAQQTFTPKKLLVNLYKMTFIRIYETCLLRVINALNANDDSADYRTILLNYFIKFFNSDPDNLKFFSKLSNKLYTEKATITLLIIIIKLLYYDTKNTQSKFKILNNKYISPSDDQNQEESSDICKQFFIGFFNKLQKVFVLNFSTSLNFFMLSRYSKISELNKLMLQFLQLLAEGFNTTFKPKIYELQLSTTESISIFDFIYNQLKAAYNLMDLQATIANNNELSHYKLIVLFSNIVDFFKEYIEGTDISKITNDSNKILIMMENFLNDNIHKCLLIRICDEYPTITKEKIQLKKKLLLRVKSKFLDLLICLVENGVDEIFLKRIQKELPLTKLFEEIQYNMYELLKNIQYIARKENRLHHKNLLNYYEHDYSGLSDRLIRLYLDEDSFTNSIELNFCLKLYKYMKILSDNYGIKTIEEYFADKRLDSNKISMENNKNRMNSFLSPQAVNIYRFMEIVMKKVEVNFIEENKVYKTFFVRPPLTFYLSGHTQRLFNDTVSRDSRFNKLSSLIKQTDYFMFEMVYYSHFNNTGRKINKLIDLFYLEIINYMLIVIHQIILLVHFYVPTGVTHDDYNLFPEDEKYNVTNKNSPLSLIQLGYISIVLFFWLSFQFPLRLFSNLMSSSNSTFLFNREPEEKREIIYKFEETSLEKGIFSHINFMRNINKQTSFWKIFKVSIIDCLIINRTINTFVFTMIFTVLYLTTKNALLAVFPVLFILNIITILFNMFVALYTKWRQLFTMLFFEFFCIYFYMWIGFFYFNSFFYYENIHRPSHGNSVHENLCTSAITCFLLAIDAGFRSGGGIGDMMPYASWEYDTNTYIFFFFFKLSFYIFIILILTNSCFGIIIDAFADLREKTNAMEEDKANICYICQLSRDNSLNKGIQFDHHRKNEHNMWDYVYFITYLLINDPKEMNKSEYYAWEKISSSTNDIGWIPRETEHNKN